jgi:acetyltransferase-like isoleucine patch superfamily enzyme
MYKEKGYVGGAIFNNDFSIRHFISNNKKDLPALRSSKYAQSNLSGFYTEVKKMLKKEEKVLVCGCPCQMAALRVFLRKDYENLIIVDFICLGINSPKVWQKYLNSFEERYGSPVIYAKAKSKEFGWRNLTQKVILANGKSYYETKDESNFTVGYLLTNAYCRPSCYDCQFKGFPRIADITLADYWGIDKIDKSMEKDLGTSLVMLNSRKGLTYFESVKSRINCFQTSFTSILHGNRALITPIDRPKVNRQDFFEDLDKMSFIEVSAKYNSSKVSVKHKIKNLLRFSFTIIKCTRLHIKPVLQLLKYNRWRQFSPFGKGNCLVPATKCVIEINRDANVKINGIFKLGIKRFKNSKLETRLLIEHGATLEIENDLDIMYGSDIEVFEDGVLKFGGKGATNINCTIICAERIEIGKGVMIGRNVTIRDNNGGHYINRQGYKNSRPVIIGDKAWLCEGCIIMQGVHIGEGAIIGAHAFVTGNVPAYAMVIGNPARVVDEDVLWKY